MSRIFLSYLSAFLISGIGVFGAIFFCNRVLKNKMHLTAFIVGVIDAIFVFTTVVATESKLS